MERERWIFGGAVVAAIVVIAAVVLAPEVKRELAPKGVAAWVALQPEGSEVARVGAWEVEAGTPVTLHAVLEARTAGGDTVYFTDATALELAGRRIPESSLRRWEDDGPTTLKVLWFTVEAEIPFLAVDTAEDLDAFSYQPFFRPDWPRAWSVPAGLEPRFDDHLELGSPRRERTFGVERYQVRIERFDDPRGLVPAERFSSPGPEDLRADPESFPSLLARLPGRLEPFSEVFGLPQFLVAPEAPADLRDRVREWTDRGWAFEAEELWERYYQKTGFDPGSASWRLVRLGADGPRWGVDVEPGDLVRVGGRQVVLYRDAGVEGRLDGSDVVLGTVRGATLGTLDELFESPTLVDLVSLGGGTAASHPQKGSR